MFDLNPQYITIKAKDGSLYLAAISEEKGAKLSLLNDLYRWVINDNEEDRVSLLSEISGLAMDVLDGHFADDAVIRLSDPVRNTEQQWMLLQEGEYTYFINGEMALTYEDGIVKLSAFDRLPNQQWIIENVS